MYRDHYRYCLTVFERFNGNLVHWARGNCEMPACSNRLACGATDGFLPLMLHQRGAARADPRRDRTTTASYFSAAPRGIWLPECGYTPGVELLLKDAGIRFFFVDTHGIYYGEPRPRFGVYAPVFTPSGVIAFGRDPESSRSVWSAQTGYLRRPCSIASSTAISATTATTPMCGPFCIRTGVRRSSLGLKYHAITGKVALHEKALYHPTPAFRRTPWTMAAISSTPASPNAAIAELIGRRR